MIRMAARTGLSGNLPVYAFAGGDFCAFLRMTIETEVGLERLQRLVTAAALSFELNMRGKTPQACTRPRFASETTRRKSQPFPHAEEHSNANE